MKWEELSEVCFGLVLEGRHPATMYRPEYFTTPYDQGIEILQKKGATKEDTAKVISSSYLSDASSAVHKFNGIGEYQNYDWAKALQEAYRNFSLAKPFEKAAKKLKENEDVDLLPLYGQLGEIISTDASGLTLFTDIDYTTYKPFKLTGYAPIDKVLGGIPTDGPIVIFGSSGVGKSKFVTGLLSSILATNPTETAAIYTLEMNKEHWAWRTVDLYPKILNIKDRLYVSGSVRNIEELVAEIMAKRVNYAVLDDIDNCVNGFEAGEYERVFKRVKEVCRFMGIPFFVIAQITKEAEIELAGGRTKKDGTKQGSRFLRKTDLAWSSAAWKSAALLLGLQIVHDGIDMDAENYPSEEGMATDYIIAMKSRDGWLGDKDPKFQVGPGAIVLEHTKNWSGKFYKGKVKLWGGRNSTIGE